MSEHPTHGRDCPKESHRAGGGYLHAADDDRPYDVDGVAYCGRCHVWMGASSLAPVAPDPPHVREDYREVWLSGWRAGVAARDRVAPPSPAGVVRDAIGPDAANDLADAVLEEEAGRVAPPSGVLNDEER